MYYCTYFQTYLEDDIANWTVLNPAAYYNGYWTTATLYRKNDYVKFGGSFFKVNKTHVSTQYFQQNFFDVELPGYNEVQEFSTATDYATGDIVRYGGDLYYVTRPIRGIYPTDTGFDSVIYFIKMLYSYNFRGDWNIDNDYAPGDLVRRGGELYKSNYYKTPLTMSQMLCLQITQIHPKWELIVPEIDGQTIGSR